MVYQFKDMVLHPWFFSNWDRAPANLTRIPLDLEYQVVTFFRNEFITWFDFALSYCSHLLTVSGFIKRRFVETSWFYKNIIFVLTVNWFLVLRESITNSAAVIQCDQCDQPGNLSRLHEPTRMCWVAVVDYFVSCSKNPLMSASIISVPYRRAFNVFHSPFVPS